MKVLGVIPARGGSKGIPIKNIRFLNGKPLISYTISAALSSKLSRLIVSTEDDQIAEVSRNYGAETLVRPNSLAQDETPTLPVLQHVLKALNEKFDAVMTLQPTSPLRTTKHINESIELMELHTEADSLVSVVEVPHNMSPVSLMKLENGLLTNYLKQGELLLRRQDKPVFWARNGAAIYMTRTERLEEFIFGGNIIPYEMDKLTSIDIDDELDWKIIEMILTYKSLS